MINYKLLTVDEAVMELEEGREVIATYPNSRVGFIGYHKPIADSVQKLKNEIQACGHYKEPINLRKPLTPEQLIASGTPLLAAFKDIPNKSIRPASPLILWSVVKSGKNIKFATQLDGVVFNKHITFVTNKNGNYLTIVNGVAEEVLR